MACFHGDSIDDLRLDDSEMDLGASCGVVVPKGSPSIIVIF